MTVWEYNSSTTTADWYYKWIYDLFIPAVLFVFGEYSVSQLE